MRKEIIFIFLLIININNVNALIYDQTFLFSAGGTNIQTPSGGGGFLFDTLATHNGIGDLESVLIDFDINKLISYISFPNRWKIWTGAVYVDYYVTLTSNATGLNQQYTSFTSTVDGIYFGSGVLGWNRVGTTTNITYVVYFDSINTSYANSLSGDKVLEFAYTDTIFTSYVTTTSAGNSVVSSFVTPSSNGGQITVAKAGRRKALSYDPSTIVSYQSNNNARVTFNNSTSSPELLGTFNLTKNSYTMRLIITNISDNVLYDASNSNDISLDFLMSDGIKFNLYDSIATSWVNRTILDFSLIIPTSYNLSFNQTYYNLGEQINISWLLTNPDIINYNYYIKEFDGSTILISTKNTNNELSGYWLPYHDKTIPQFFTFYIVRSPKNNSYLTEYLEMEQIGYGINNYEQNGNFSTDKTLYNQSENIIITYNLSSSGRIHIFNYLNDYYYNLNSGNNIVYNYLVPQNEGLGNMYIELDYFDGNNYITLFDSVVQIKPLNQNNMVKFRDDSIEQGRIYYLDAYLNESGYILLTNPNGEIKFNFSISADTLSNFYYQYGFNDIEGIYTGTLYNLSGFLITSDTNYLNSGIITPKPTITPSPTTDNIFNFNDENGEVSDIMIKRRGNDWFNIIFLACVSLVIIGIYWKARGK